MSLKLWGKMAEIGLGVLSVRDVRGISNVNFLSFRGFFNQRKMETG
jgi:hypothetical protein